MEVGTHSPRVSRLAAAGEHEVVEARTKLVNAARGIAKSIGERLARCDADQVGPRLVAGYRRCPELFNDFETPARIS